MSTSSAFDTLAVGSFKNRILELIGTNEISVIESNTGSGKTLGIPQYLNEAGKTVLCLEPRNILAISSAESASEMKGTPVGEDVGYMVTKTTEQQSAFNHNTKTIYATFSYALMRQLVLKPDASPVKFDVLVLDEIHENILAQTILLAMLRKYLKKLNVKLVIMSATLDVDKIKYYFNGYRVDSIYIDNKTYPLDIIEEKEVGDAEALAQQALKYLYSDDKNGCIVFVDGIADVKETYNVLNKIRVDLGFSDLDLMTLSSESSSEDRVKFFSPLPQGRKRIGIATSIAESGLSAKWIDCGASNGMGKRWQLSGEDQLVLITYPLAQWRIIQQAGRTNRFGPGSFTVFSGETSIADRPMETEAEINLLPLDTLALYCAYAGTSATELKFFGSSDKKTTDIIQCQYNLQRDECLKLTSESDSFTITEKGEFFLMTPLATKEALSFLYTAKKEGNMDLKNYLIYACLIDTGSFYTPGKTNEGVITSDIEAMYRDIDSYMSGNDYDISASASYLVSQHISPARFRSVRDTILRLEESMSIKGYIPGDNHDWFSILKECRRIQFMAHYTNLFILTRPLRRSDSLIAFNSKGSYSVSNNSPTLEFLQVDDFVIAYPKLISNKQTGRISSYVMGVTRYMPQEVKDLLKALITKKSISIEMTSFGDAFICYKNNPDGTSDQFGNYPLTLIERTDDPVGRFDVFMTPPKDTAVEQVMNMPGPRSGFRFRRM